MPLVRGQLLGLRKQKRLEQRYIGLYKNVSDHEAKQRRATEKYRVIPHFGGPGRFGAGAQTFPRSGRSVSARKKSQSTEMGLQWIQRDAERRGVYIQAGGGAILSIESGRIFNGNGEGTI